MASTISSIVTFVEKLQTFNYSEAIETLCLTIQTDYSSSSTLDVIMAVFRRVPFGCGDGRVIRIRLFDYVNYDFQIFLWSLSMKGSDG